MKRLIYLSLFGLCLMLVSCGSSDNRRTAKDDPPSVHDDIPFPVTLNFTYGEWHGEHMTVKFSSRDIIESAKDYCYTTFDASSLTSDYDYLDESAKASVLSGTDWSYFLLNMRSSINGRRRQTYICVNWEKRQITNFEPADVRSSLNGEKKITVYQF